MPSQSSRKTSADESFVQWSFWPLSRVETDHSFWNCLSPQRADDGWTETHWGRLLSGGAVSSDLHFNFSSWCQFASKEVCNRLTALWFSYEIKTITKLPNVICFYNSSSVWATKGQFTCHACIIGQYAPVAGTFYEDYWVHFCWKNSLCNHTRASQIDSAFELIAKTKIFVSCYSGAANVLVWCAGW